MADKNKSPHQEVIEQLEKLENMKASEASQTISDLAEHGFFTNPESAETQEAVRKKIDELLGKGILDGTVNTKLTLLRAKIGAPSGIPRIAGGAPENPLEAELADLINKKADYKMLMAFYLHDTEALRKAGYDLSDDEFEQIFKKEKIEKFANKKDFIEGLAAGIAEGETAEKALQEQFEWMDEELCKVILERVQGETTRILLVNLFGVGSISIFNKALARKALREMVGRAKKTTKLDENALDNFKEIKEEILDGPLKNDKEIKALIDELANEIQRIKSAPKPTEKVSPTSQLHTLVAEIANAENLLPTTSEEAQKMLDRLKESDHPLVKAVLAGKPPKKILRARQDTLKYLGIEGSDKTDARVNQANQDEAIRQSIIKLIKGEATAITEAPESAPEQLDVNRAMDSLEKWVRTIKVRLPKGLDKNQRSQEFKKLLDRLGLYKSELSEFVKRIGALDDPVIKMVFKEKTSLWDIVRVKYPRKKDENEAESVRLTAKHIREVVEKISSEIRAERGKQTTPATTETKVTPKTFTYPAEFPDDLKSILEKLIANKGISEEDRNYVTRAFKVLAVPKPSESTKALKEKIKLHYEALTGVIGHVDEIAQIMVVENFVKEAKQVLGKTPPKATSPDASDKKRLLLDLANDRLEALFTTVYEVLEVADDQVNPDKQERLKKFQEWIRANLLAIPLKELKSIPLEQEGALADKIATRFKPFETEFYPYFVSKILKNGKEAEPSKESPKTSGSTPKAAPEATKTATEKLTEAKIQEFMDTVLEDKAAYQPETDVASRAIRDLLLKSRSINADEMRAFLQNPNVNTTKAVQAILEDPANTATVLKTRMEENEQKLKNLQEEITERAESLRNVRLTTDLRANIEKEQKGLRGDRLTLENEIKNDKAALLIRNRRITYQNTRQLLAMITIYINRDQPNFTETDLVNTVNKELGRVHGAMYGEVNKFKEVTSIFKPTLKATLKAMASDEFLTDIGADKLAELEDYYDKPDAIRTWVRKLPGDSNYHYEKSIPRIMAYLEFALQDANSTHISRFSTEKTRQLIRNLRTVLKDKVRQDVAKELSSDASNLDRMILLAQKLDQLTMQLEEKKQDLIRQRANTNMLKWGAGGLATTIGGGASLLLPAAGLLNPVSLAGYAMAGVVGIPMRKWVEKKFSKEAGETMKRGAIRAGIASSLLGLGVATAGLSTLVALPLAGAAVFAPELIKYRKGIGKTASVGAVGAAGAGAAYKGGKLAYKGAKAVTPYAWKAAKFGGKVMLSIPTLGAPFWLPKVLGIKK